MFWLIVLSNKNKTGITKSLLGLGRSFVLTMVEECGATIGDHDGRSVKTKIAAGTTSSPGHSPYSQVRSSNLQFTRRGELRPASRYANFLG
jgi:hypothetical protein